MKGLWICADERPKKTGFYDFHKTIVLHGTASVRIQACADTRYQLRVNNTLVCEGPCQGSEYVRYYETVQIPQEILQDGENDLWVRVLYMGENQFISVYRESRPALWLRGEVEDADGKWEFRSDRTWEILRDDATGTHYCPGIHISVAPFEDHAAFPHLTPVPVREMYETDEDRSCFNIFGLRELYPLAPRPIPDMRTHEKRDLRILRKGDGFIELDTGRYTTAKVSIRCHGKNGGNVRIVYAECMAQKQPDGSLIKEIRDDENGVFADTCVWDTLQTNGGETAFSPFWYRAFRYMRIEYDDPTFVLDEASYADYFYPVDHIGNFVCSDETYNEMWKISENTVKCCMHEIYVDCPFYEQQQYDMDSALEALFTYRMTGDTRMQKKCITDMAHSQLPDGMLQANYPSVGMQVIPNFSLFWIFMLRDYLLYTGDDAFVRQHTGTMDKILEGFHATENEQGLLSPTPYWHFVDWVPGWHVGVPAGGWDEPLTVSNLMYAAALGAGAWIARAVGRPHLSGEYLERQQTVNQNTVLHCYDTEKGLFRNTPTRAEYSEHTTLWAILSGAVSGNEASALMDRTRNTADVARCTFSMNHYMFRALEMSNRYDALADRLMDGWRQMMDLHCTSWCETPGNCRSECHGWSSAPLYELSAMYLGIQPETPGFASVIIRPHRNGLRFAKGTVPTPQGPIHVEWTVEKDTLTLDATLPVGVSATVLLPDHAPFRTKDHRLHIVSHLTTQK